MQLSRRVVHSHARWAVPIRIDNCLVHAQRDGLRHLPRERDVPSMEATLESGAM